MNYRGNGVQSTCVQCGMTVLINKGLKAHTNSKHTDKTTPTSDQVTAQNDKQDQTS